MKNICFIFLFLFTFNFLLNAQTVVLNASKDNTIYSDNINNSNGAGPNFTTGAIASLAVRRGLLMFDISSIPSGATITAVSLRLVMNMTVSGANNVSLHRLNENWGEGASDAGSFPDGQGAPAQAGDATWICSFSNGAGGCTTSWSTAGAAFQATASATASVNSPAPYTWSSAQLITDVQGWLNTPATNFGWVIIGAEGVPRSAKRFSSRTNPTVADRPTLTVTYSTIVPINLLYFKAQAQNSGTRLSWQTAQEINNDYFEIEFSTDGASFTPVGKVKGGGNTSLPQSYNFTHRTNQTGKVFYRLSQTDFNGRKTYSRVEFVDLKNTGSSLTISPNPVTGKIVIPGFVIDGKQRYSILNLQGIKIAEAGLSKQEILLPNNISPGMYMLRILQGNGSVQSTSFIKY
jgi:hypothetical protein